MNLDDSDIIEMAEEIERLKLKVNRLIDAFDTLATETASAGEWIEHFGFLPDDFVEEDTNVY